MEPYTYKIARAELLPVIRSPRAAVKPLASTWGLCIAGIPYVTVIPHFLLIVVPRVYESPSKNSSSVAPRMTKGNKRVSQTEGGWCAGVRSGQCRDLPGSQYAAMRWIPHSKLALRVLCISEIQPVQLTCYSELSA